MAYPLHLGTLPHGKPIVWDLNDVQYPFRAVCSPASPSQRVFVGSLSYDTTWEVLKDFFKQAGNVTYASVSTREDGSSKGCGVVQFSTVEEAQVSPVDMPPAVSFPRHRLRNTCVSVPPTPNAAPATP